MLIATGVKSLLADKQKPSLSEQDLKNIKKLAKDAGLDDLRLLELIQTTLNSDEAVLELLKSHEASRMIEVLK